MIIKEADKNCLVDGQIYWVETTGFGWNEKKGYECVYNRRKDFLYLCNRQSYFTRLSVFSGREITIFEIEEE